MNLKSLNLNLHLDVSCGAFPEDGHRGALVVDEVLQGGFNERAP